MKPLTSLLDSIEDSAPTSDRRIRQDRLTSTIRELRQILRDVLGSGNDRALIDALNALGRNRVRIEQALVAWVDLIEELVQDAEMRFGTASGRGAMKASEVKAVFRYLLKTEGFDIPSIPGYLEGAIVDVALDWTIDAVVLVLNENGELWIASDPAPRTVLTRTQVFVRRIVLMLRPIWQSVLMAGIRLWRYIRYSPPLSPQLRARVDAVRQRGLISDPAELINTAVSGVVWVGTHREQVIGLFELVAAAVQEAEYVGSLSGQEKKVYARDLIFAVLADLGYYVRSGLPFALVDALLDAAIEAAVHLFHKRGVFT